jgi:hypothetical protein
VHSCRPIVLGSADWRPSDVLLDALADALLIVAEQRQRARLAHAPAAPGQPDASYVKDDISDSEEG